MSAANTKGTDASRRARRTAVLHKINDWSFAIVLCVGVALYAFLLVSLVAVDVAYLYGASAQADDAAAGNPLWTALQDPNIRYSLRLTIVSCTMAAILSVLVAVPIGYALSKPRFRGQQLLETLIDIPIVLPPLVVGISLLILFQYLPASWQDAVVYEVPAVILAQFVVASAFAIQTMRNTFQQMDGRMEQVALTLGCNKWQAFSWITLPQARSGIVTAFTMAWARALGEFGPLLVFAGTTRGKTEVLSTSVFLELSIGNLKGCVAVSVLMIAIATLVLAGLRLWGSHERS